MHLRVNDIRAIIAEQLANELSKDGFKYKKSMNEFVCKNDNYSYTFNIDIVSWSNSISIHVRLFISQKQIEVALDKILGRQRHKITLGNDIGKIYTSSDGREVETGDMSIWIRQEEDIEAAIESLMWYYCDIAKPYFNNFTNLEAIEKIINNPPFDYCPAYVGGNFDDRCMKGLIVAKLTNSVKFQELAEIYDEKMKGTMNMESIINYNKVREFLQYNRSC